MLPCKTPLLLKDLFFIHIIRNSVNFRIFRKHFIRTIERIEKPKKNRTFTVRRIFWWEWVRPRYAITKIKKISLGRFFKIFLIVYSRIGHACRWHSDRSTHPTLYECG